MRRALVWLVAVVVTGVAVGVALGHGSTPIAAKASHGFDVSWPQCDGSDAHNMPSGDPSYVILGLTDGAGHTVNPCLGAQLNWARSHGTRVGAYLVASYPSKLQQALAGTGAYGVCGKSVICRLRNDGAAQAQQALATMTDQGVRAPRVWIDVEFRRFESWTSSQVRNGAVLQGIVHGLKAGHMAMGIYTTSHMWNAIAGGYRVDVPNWLPSGDGKPAHAEAMCQTTATGGVTWLVQYTRGLDSDLTCPVLDAVPSRHNHLWKFRNTTEGLLSSGPAVSALQREVGETVTGDYDAFTTLKVTSWQASMGLPVSGSVTPIDWRAMGAFRTHGGHGFMLSRIAGPS